MTPDANGEAQAANTAVPSAPGARQTRGLLPFAPGQNSQTGEVHRRGPDRKPRQVNRLALTRALVAVTQQNGRAVPGIEALALGYRAILGNHNHKFFLQLGQLIKETFDDAPDSGSGRTTVFLFPSEVEEERKRLGLPPFKPGEQQPPPTPQQPPPPAPQASPLAGLEELEEPPG